jgi:hypothetical protein
MVATLSALPRAPEAPVGAVRAALGAPADLQDVVGLAAQGGPSSCRTLDWN